MTKTNAIKLFEDKKVRSIWDDETEEWYFCIIDVISSLTDTVNPTDYIKKMKKRDEMLAKGWGQIVTPLSIQTAGGKQKVNFANAEGIFRIIQSIPSPKAEPFKQWMAQVAAERVNQIQDPERSINQALLDYKWLGYSDNWINQRLTSIEIRKDLTDQWKEHNVKEGVQYATLTDIIYQAWTGKSAKDMLAELSTTSITKAKDPQSFEENQQYAAEGGNVAFVARQELEAKTGRSVITPLSAKRFFDKQSEDKEEDKKIGESE